MKRIPPRRYLWFSLWIISLFSLFSLSDANETHLVRVRKGDTISYLSFKIYGMYDPKMGELLRKENTQIKNLNLIYAGQQIRFPAPGVMKKWLGEKGLKPVAPGLPPEPKKPAPPKPGVTLETPIQVEPMAPTQVRANKGVITFLEGQAQVKKAGKPQWSSARPNMILLEQDQVKVLARSRVELILDNQSVMRLSENTVLTIQKIEEEPASQKETVKTELSLGRLWTRASKLFNPASRYDVKTPTAIAGVQGTIYQVSVADDQSTSIQVYEGAVNVYNPFPPAKPSLPGERIGKPHEVPGPGEVPGPTTVSREEWTSIVLRQFQQITVTGRGISRPAPFDVQKERQKEWVRWNEERDSDFQPPERPR